MFPERFQQIAELYHTARESTAEDRAALLDRADPELRREVESLLAQDTEGGFLERPLAEDAISLLGDGANPALIEGTQLGPYRIECKLGEGGMGEVYRAIDTRLGRAVAIKLVRKRFNAAFRREARAIAALNHPNICALHDIGPDYMVMELVEGETLAARLKRGALPIGTALAYASQILAALAEAHAKGIVHRDLKPGNIMLAKSGIKVLDFGLAKFVADETVTATGNAMGTPAYVSPEQRQGRPADPRSDIWSFGCVLYEMLTGARVGARRQRIMPRKLEDIVDRCLEDDPSVRWQTVTELQQALATVTTGHGWRSAMDAAIPPVLKTRRAQVIAAIFVLAAIGAAGWFRFAHPAHPLTDKDTIVLADFANHTGDPVFDGTLRQGLSVQLEQSPFLSIVPDAQIQQTLELMGRKPDARLTPGIARELCQRTGSAAVLEGSIAQIGTPYLLTLKAVDCADGASLASAEAQASDKSHVLDALGRTASQIRAKLGESLSTVRKFDTPLEQATTPSLEALKAYSVGHQIMGTQGPAAAIPFYEKATELDPDFASAYAWLGIEYTSLGESTIGAGYTSKAYALRGRASERERYFISAVYDKEVTGDIPQAVQTCALWAQVYPRAAMPHNYLAGAIYPIIGDYAKGVEESRQSIRLNPEDPVPYAFGMFNATALDRLGVAKAFYRQAVARKLRGGFYPIALYQIAFLEHDTAGMSRQAAASTGPAIEDELLGMEADTAAYSGQLGAAREFSRRAMESAERQKENEAVATYLAMSALREALFGNPQEARRNATLVMEHSPGVDARFGAALALAFAGDAARAQALADALDKQYPESTLVQSNYLPAIRAELAIRQGDPPGALEYLRAAAPYELGQTRYSAVYWTAMYPVYVRGEAWLAAGKGAEAAAEFQKILDHGGIVVNEPIGALARLQLGRAYAMEARSSQGTDARAAYAKARAAYRDFLALWKNADPGVPVLKQANVEYAKLKVNSD